MSRKERFDELRIASAPVSGENPIRLRDIDDLDLEASGDVADGGYTEATGDGATATFTWDTVAEDPVQWAHITPTTEAASADYHVDVSAGTITVTYAAPPSDGDALGWFWAVGDSSESSSTDDKATKFARYITLGDEAELPDSVNHSNVTGAENLHAPKAHGDEAHDIVYLKPEDAEDFAAALHGDAAHSETYVKPADLDSKADDPHGNEAHDSNFATTSDVGTKADEPHGNEAHTSEYATTTAVADKADDPHGDEAHDGTVASSGELDSHESSTGGVHGVADTDSVASQSEVDEKAPQDGGGTANLTNYDSISANTVSADNLSGGGDGAPSPHGNDHHSVDYAPRDGGGSADLVNYDSITANSVNADNISGSDGSGGNTYNVENYGADGSDSSDDATGFHNAIDAADAAGGGTVYIPPGTFYVDDDFVIPTGVAIKGAGEAATTIRSTYSGMNTFLPENHTDISGFSLDQNCANRGRDMSVGIRLEGGVHNCDISRIEFRNISNGWEGKAIEFYCEESDDHDTFANSIRGCDVRGDFQNGDNSGDFLIRARTNFGADRAAEDFTRFIRDNWIDQCTFRGEGKAAIEWVGPATIRNVVTGCIARDFTTCTGIFESSLGGKHNTFRDCGIYNCYGDSTCIGFLSDGWAGTPERRSEYDLFDGCRVRGFHQLRSGSSIRGFRIRRGDHCKINNGFVEDMSVPSGSSGTAQGVNLYLSTEPELHSMTIHGVDTQVVNSQTSSPVWNHTVNGGPL